MNAGSASAIFFMSIRVMDSIIKTPTSTNVPVVAAPGMSRKMGAKKMAKRNIPPVTSEVNPERPPSATPEALSK